MKEYDVIIVGSGFAGLFAAIEASKNGASVVVLEKMTHFGGNSIISAGQIAVPNSDEQSKLLIDDSKELLIKDMLDAGRGVNNLKLVNKFVSEVNGVYHDLKEIGVEFKKEVYQFGGHSIPRVLLTLNESGRDMYAPLFNQARKQGVVFKNKALVEKILCDECSKILGIRVRENFEFDSQLSGTICNYMYKKSLIIASGGWSADKKFISLQNPLYSNFETTANVGATSECIRFLLGIDAVPILLNSYLLGPWASPDERGANLGAMFADHAFLGGIIVDASTGKRFVNEMSDKKTIADMEIKHIDKNGMPVYPILLCAEAVANRSAVKNDALQSGVLKVFNDTRSLSQTYGIDCSGLADEIVKWNSFVRNGCDADFGKPMQFALPIEGKIYAMRLWPKIHYCNGGVAISENTRLISMKTLEEMNDVYACGEITGGLHGECRLAAVSALDAMVFGKTAGIVSCQNSLTPLF